MMDIKKDLSVNVGAAVNGKRKMMAELGIGTSVTLEKKENGVWVCRIRMENQGEREVKLEDVYVDFAIRPALPWGIVPKEDMDDYYLLLPFGKESGGRLLIMPYDLTQLELCERVEEEGVWRCYLYAHERKKEMPYRNRKWKNPFRSLVMESQSRKEWIFMMSVVDNFREISEFLMQYGRVPEGIEDGANGMRAIAHHFFEHPVSLQVYYNLANSYQSATFTNGRLSSLQCTGSNVEAIDSRNSFGDVTVIMADGSVLDTAKEKASEEADRSMVFRKNGVTARIRFDLKGKILTWTLVLENRTLHEICIEDIRLPVALNSRMEWGVDPAGRVIRHSQVAGDNSFFLATPCDGKAPYLLCIPQNNTRWELFDMDEEQGKNVYCVYLHGNGAAKRAKQKEGGRWRLPVTGLVLKPEESVRYALDFQWVSGYMEARDALVSSGKIDIRVMPGLTVPRGQEVRVLLRGKYDRISLCSEYPDQTEVALLRQEGDRFLYRVRFNRLGENLLSVHYGDGKTGWIEMFSTLPIEELIQKRADYIRRCQISAPGKWFDGLLRERNSKTGVLLDPEHYDEIEGWRRYEVTCDDPGLSKPAFLASKNAELPDIEEIRALETYVEHFVWGGLQRTDEEEYPYAIYGIPDWHDLRSRKNLNANELLHVWRLYDYPHIILMYLKLYEIGKENPDILMKQDAVIYLERAYGTCLAMYQYPFEIEHSYAWSNGYWNPYQTGFYNELAIVDLIEALRAENMPEKARRLEYHWQHKADFFIRECRDLFGSEYAFDTTGFESTQAIVNWGRKHATSLYNSDARSILSYTPAQVESFDQLQRACNIACRGYMENAYYITGSDIRGESSKYTLGYMSQMGGWALLQDALYAEDSDFELLRLAYTSLLSSWAILNAGDEKSGYGYWFPGAANDGATSGGFEAVPYGMTWLGPAAHHGVWIYGCETDLGYCGYLRGAAIVFAQDPEFGEVCYGGVVETEGGEKRILPVDGVGRQFHIIKNMEERLHVLIYEAHLKEIRIRADGKILLQLTQKAHGRARMRVFTHEGKEKLIIGKMIGKDVEASLDGLSQIVIDAGMFMIARE